MLNTTDDKTLRLMAALQENCYKALDAQGMTCEANRVNNQVHAKDGRKYIAIDYGSSGHFMVDRETEQVYSIKGYRVVNLQKPRGTVEFLTAFVKDMTDKGLEYRHRYWYALHPTS